MRVAWTLMLSAGLAGLAVLVGAAFGVLRLAAEVVAAASIVTAAICTLGIWKLYRLERRERERRATQLVGRLLLLSAHVDLLRTLIGVELENRDRSSSTLHQVLSTRLDSLVRLIRALHDDALDANETTLSSINAVDIHLSIARAHLADAQDPARAGPVEAEELEPVAEHLERVKEGLLEAADALPDPTDSAIEHHGQYVLELQDQVYGAEAGEDGPGSRPLASPGRRSMAG